MWKMPAKERIQIRSSHHQQWRECWTVGINSRFAPPLTWRCSGKKKHYYAAIILNYRNVAKHLWREPQLIKFENAFHIWINIGYICERTLSAVSHVKSRFRARLLQLTIASSLCRYSFRAEFHKIGQLPTASCVLLMVSRIIFIYFNKCNRLDIIIFRL